MIKAGEMRKIRFSYEGLSEDLIDQLLSDPEGCEGILREGKFIDNSEGVGAWKREEWHITFYIVKKKNKILYV